MQIIVVGPLWGGGGDKTPLTTKQKNRTSWTQDKLIKINYSAGQYQSTEKGYNNLNYLKILYSQI